MTLNPALTTSYAFELICDVKIKQKLSCAVESAVQHLASVMEEKGRKRHEVASVMKEKIPANCIVVVSISIHNPPHEGT